MAARFSFRYSTSMTINPNDPIWTTPIKTRSLRNTMGAIRDYHLNLREEGNALWKAEIEKPEPDVEMLMALKPKLEAHGVYAILSSKLCAGFDAAVFKARHPEAPE